MAQKLPAHEWLIIVLIIAILLILSAIAYLGEERFLPSTGVSHDLVSQEIEVIIAGAVTKPGTYVLRKDALLKDLLELCKPLPEADLRRLNLEGKLRHGQKVRIITKPLITIFVGGAVEKPGALQVLKGTKLEDLLKHIQFTPEADLKKMQRKRRLKDQEVIHVPIKEELKSQKRNQRKKPL